MSDEDENKVVQVPMRDLQNMWLTILFAKDTLLEHGDGVSADCLAPALEWFDACFEDWGIEK